MALLSQQFLDPILEFQATLSLKKPSKRLGGMWALLESNLLLTFINLIYIM